MEKVVTVVLHCGNSPVCEISTMAVNDLVIKWSGKEFNVTCNTDRDTVLDLKKAIYKETGVSPKRQKLLGCKVKG